MIEDEYLIAMEVKRWLEGAGVTVVGPVPSVEQALDLMEDGGLDAAMLDVNLGDGATVYPVADRLDAVGVPYLFGTGDTQVLDGNGYRQRLRLEKPYLAGDVTRALTTLLSVR